MRWYLPALVICLGCATAGEVHEPAFHTPLVNTSWKPLAPRPVPGREEPVEGDDDLRTRMVEAARALLGESNGASGGGYGARDLQRLLDEVEVEVDWDAGRGLEALVSTARKKDAYSTDPDPRPGDIALFHNVWDANLNGETDDWLSGCGVVVERRRGRFEAVVRSGHGPRQVIAWPDGPAVRVKDSDQVNSFLRVPSRSDPEGTAYLAGQLYAGFIDIDTLAAGAGE